MVVEGHASQPGPGVTCGGGHQEVAPTIGGKEPQLGSRHAARRRRRTRRSAPSSARAHRIRYGGWFHSSGRTGKNRAARLASPAAREATASSSRLPAAERYGPTLPRAAGFVRRPNETKAILPRTDSEPEQAATWPLPAAASRPASATSPRATTRASSPRRARSASAALAIVHGRCRATSSFRSYAECQRGVWCVETKSRRSLRNVQRSPLCHRKITNQLCCLQAEKAPHAPIFIKVSQFEGFEK